MDLHGNQAKRTYNLVRRNGKLYDKVTHTDVFTEDLDLDVVRLYSFEDLPTSFRRYITYRASRTAATQLVANPQLVKLLAQQELYLVQLLWSMSAIKQITACLDLTMKLTTKPINHLEI